jgi:hypothetical protein
MSKNANYIYPSLAMSNDIILGGLGVKYKEDYALRHPADRVILFG